MRLEAHFEEALPGPEGRLSGPGSWILALAAEAFPSPGRCLLALVRLLFARFRAHSALGEGEGRMGAWSQRSTTTPQKILGREKGEWGGVAKALPGGGEVHERWGVAAAVAMERFLFLGVPPWGEYLKGRCLAVERPACPGKTHFLYGHGITRSWRFLLPCVFYEFPCRVFSPCAEWWIRISGSSLV